MSSNSTVPSVEASDTAPPYKSLRFTSSRPRSFFLRFHLGGYWLAVFTVVLAFWLRLAVDPWLGDQDPYIVFVVAIAVTGLYAGVRPAILATALGTVVAYFCFVPPRYQFGFAGIGDAVGFGVYLITAIAVVLLIHARMRAASQAEQALEAHIQSEQKLYDAQTLFRNFMDHSSACAYLRDEDGRCVYANEVAKREFGIDLDPSASRATDGAATSQFRDQDRRVLDLGHGMEFVDRAPGASGERYWLTSKFPFVDMTGHRFVGAISFEITDRINAEEILRKTERLSAGQQMASLLAHEINNPLAALTNIVFLLTQQSLPSPAHEFVLEAKEALSRINRIASMTLDFYFDEDMPAPLDVCQLVDEVVEMLTATEGFRKIQILREFSEAHLIASPPRIRQLIISLLTNAMESGAQKLRIRVRMGWDWHRRSRGGVRITVADDGRGIPRELREKVFEPFVSTKGERGSGLGLWASRAVVLRNDGTIRLRSRTGGASRGTCVRLFLPALAPSFEDSMLRSDKTA